MKKITAFISSILFVLGIMSCSSGSSSHSDDSSPSSRLLSFDLSNATAIASVESAGNSARFARAAEADDSPLVKVLDNSTVASVLSLPSDVNIYNFPKITAVKTVEDTSGHKYLYIFFEHSFHWSYYDETTGEGKDGETGQLLCVYEDGSYVDILSGLKSSSGNYINIETSWNGNESEKMIDFDAAGNMYLCTSEYTGSSSSSVFYKYDVSAKQASQLTARNSNASYSKFQISADGKKLFTSGNNNNGSFIRCIPTDSPNDMKFIEPPVKNYSLSSWVYQDSTGFFYMMRNYTYEVPTEWDYTYTQTQQGLFRIRISDFIKNGTAEWEQVSSPELDNIYAGYYDYYDLHSTSKGIWATVRQNISLSYSDNNLTYFVDTAGNYKGESISLQDYKLNNTVVSDDALYFADNSAGTGYQTIIRFDLSSKTFSNLFDNVPNRNSLEVVSFSEGNGMLYFSATRGIDNVNGSINLRTKAFTPMDSSKKITSITSY